TSPCVDLPLGILYRVEGDSCGCVRRLKFTTQDAACCARARVRANWNSSTLNRIDSNDDMSTALYMAWLTRFASLATRTSTHENSPIWVNPMPTNTAVWVGYPNRRTIADQITNFPT